MKKQEEEMQLKVKIANELLRKAREEFVRTQEKKENEMRKEISKI